MEVTRLIGVAARTFPALHLLSNTIRFDGFRTTFCPNVSTLSSIRPVLNRDVPVVGDIELLLRQAFVALPDLETLSVGTEVGSEIDAELCLGKVVGCYPDLGATLIIDEVLKSVKVEVFGEAYVTVEVVMR